MADFSKIDAGLYMALKAFEQERLHGEEDHGISILLKFKGDLAAIEAIGFETMRVDDGEAHGIVKFGKIAELTDHPGVIWMSAGMPKRPTLNIAAKDVRTRAANAAGVSTSGNGLWFPVGGVAAPGIAALNPKLANATGSGVIIAVIDTGIDFQHVKFMKQLSPTKATRILRIWDQGLTPATIADCPNPSLLFSATRTYGVEYDEREINAALNGGAAVAHRDCISHGTHVACIAAGGPIAEAGDPSELVGIAPEADIIAVKLLDTPNTVRYFAGAGSPGAEVDPTTRFKDAVLYCLRTARALSKPIVINISSGVDWEPGDGLDEEARWVDELLDPARPADVSHFPSGAIIVKSAGNNGDLTRRRVATIDIPESGEVRLKLALTDSNPSGVNENRVNCIMQLYKPPIGVSIWYRRDFDRVSFAVKIPGLPVTSDMTVGGYLERRVALRIGPPSATVVLGASANERNSHLISFVHHGNPAVNHPATGTVRRHNAQFWVHPKVNAGTVSYFTGDYELLIKGPPGTVLFAYCSVAHWGISRSVGFAITGDYNDVTLTSEFSAIDTLGKHAITVAAYDDKNFDAAGGGVAPFGYRQIAPFSSRGPLRDFSDPPGSKPLVADKPDIAAPGVNIMAAISRDDEKFLPAFLANQFGEMSGASMATPIIAGIVALMLDKNPNLNVNQVRHILAGAADVAGLNAPGGSITNAYGAGVVNALKSHVNTP